MREAQGLTLRQLADSAGVSFAYLSLVERQGTMPSARWLRDVSEALAEHLGGAA